MLISPEQKIPVVPRGSQLHTEHYNALINCYNTTPIGSMYAIYGNIYHQYTPVMLV